MLFNEPKLLKCSGEAAVIGVDWVSVLFNEPKLLKSSAASIFAAFGDSFSALQRAEIAEMGRRFGLVR